MAKQKINLKIDLSEGITILPRKVQEAGKAEETYIEGIIRKSENGRYEIDEKHGLYDGSQIELLLCGTWVKTNIKLTGDKYGAEGLKGLRLVGITARILL